MTVLNVKTCTKCAQSKPFDDFYRRSDGRLRAACKQCHKLATYQWNAQHPKRKAEMTRRAMAKYYASEKGVAYRRSETTKARVNQRQAAYRATEEGKRAIAALARSGREKCNPGYVRGVLIKATGLSGDSIPQDLIELKRQQIQLKRLAKQMQQASNQAKEDDESVPEHP